MKIEDLRIGMKVCEIGTRFPMIVTGIFSTLDDMAANKGTVYCDFEGNEGDIWEVDINELEVVDNK